MADADSGPRLTPQESPRAVESLRRLRSLPRRRPAFVTAAGTLLVAAALAFALAGKWDEFVVALGAAPLWILGMAAVLHLLWLVARSEAWHVCVDAADGTVPRRRLYRAASLGYLGNLFNANFGVAVRIAALRRSAPDESPPVSTLVAAEFPIIVVEAALAALMSFTLVGPLGLPWWFPLAGFAGMCLVLSGLRLVARNRRSGFWKGLAVLRGLAGRNRIVAIVFFALTAQVVRNWLLLNGMGIDATVFDAIALLIGLAVIGFLPVGPSLGAAAAVIVLGTNGVAATAAAGALLTATAVLGALAFAVWALVDRLRPQPSVGSAG